VTTDHEDTTSDTTIDAEDAQLDETSGAAEEVEAADASPVADGGDEPAADADADADATERRGRLARLLLPLALAVVLLGSAGFASWLYLTQFRPDRETDSAVAGETIRAASDGAVALLSYAPETMDKDFAGAKSHLTGDFLNYYSQFTHDIVTPAVQQKAVKTSATIVQSAVSELKPDSAVVLVFLNQTTTSKENPNGSFTASSVKVGLTKVDGSWLISAFDPV
jgi:Mce-associated membrane protein